MHVGERSKSHTEREFPAPSILTGNSSESFHFQHLFGDIDPIITAGSVQNQLIPGIGECCWGDLLAMTIFFRQSA